MFLRSSNDVGRFPCITTAVSATTDIYYHEQPQALGKSMWTAGPEGVSIYSPDGATVIKKMSPADLGCPSPEGCFFLPWLPMGTVMSGLRLCMRFRIAWMSSPLTVENMWAA
jgi:hypothetical protein